MPLPFIRRTALDPLAVELARLRNLRQRTELLWLYALAKDWQTALVGGLGFLGIIVTLEGQVAADRIEQRAHEQQEANHLRIALAVELQSIADTSEDYAEKLQAGTNIVISISPQDLVFQHYVEKLSLLCPDEITAIYKTYNLQKLFIPLIAATFAPLPIPGYFNVKPQAFKNTATFYQIFSRANASTASLLYTRQKLPDNANCENKSVTRLFPGGLTVAPHH